jgi:hypothetical protein
MPEPPRETADETQARRRRWVGRLVVIGFGLLLLAYLIPLAILR